MAELNEQSPRVSVLALLWHSPHSAVTAGGFKRTYEIFKRIPPGAMVHAVDNGPSFLADIKGERLEVEEYRIPRLLRALERRFYRTERLTERVLSFALMVIRSLELKRSGRDFDTVFVAYSEIFTMLAAGVVAKAIFKNRLVLTNHNIEHFNPLMRRLVVAMHKHADAVIAVSEDLKARLEGYGVRVQLVVNSNGLDTDYIGASLTGAPAQKVYDGVFVGRHVPAKGIFDLVRAWGVVAESMPSAKLITLGSCDPGAMDGLQSLLADLGISDLVTIRGIVDEDEKYRLIAGSRILLFPSYMEGWGLVPQEALACGLPAVVYDLPVYAENIKPCEAVFAVPVGDYREMGLETVRLLRGDEYLECASAGPRFVKRFDWGEIADREFEVLSGRIPEGGTP